MDVAVSSTRPSTLVSLPADTVPASRMAAVGITTVRRAISPAHRRPPRRTTPMATDLPWLTATPDPTAWRSLVVPSLCAGRRVVCVKQHTGAGVLPSAMPSRKMRNGLVFPARSG
jgi:hypothetical protein